MALVFLFLAAEADNFLGEGVAALLEGIADSLKESGKGYSALLIVDA